MRSNKMANQKNEPEKMDLESKDKIEENLNKL
jgi:hypothetical protein